MPHAMREPAEMPGTRLPSAAWFDAIEARWPGAARRSAGIVLALLLEAALLLLLFTLGYSGPGEDKAGEALATFTAAPDEPERPEPAEQERAAPAEPRPIRVQTPPATESPPRPSPTAAPPTPAPALIPLSKSQMASADIAGIKPPAGASATSPVGPADTGRSGDSQRVSGSGPNGEPLYAARWYREPYDDELRGYLSTASGPGWALINCRTVPDFRVEDCVLEAEQPAGSNIGAAVLSAAWQFKVRPPRIGGRSMVGEWVRIRIDYQRRRAAPASGY